MRFKTTSMPIWRFVNSTFNSLYEIPKGSSSIGGGGGLSILFMRFKLYVFMAAELAWLTFNSLYEIPTSVTSHLQHQNLFQFSLWDSEGGQRVRGLSWVGFFQFSLWDSIEKINEKELLITALSILFMRFRGEFLFFRFK